MTERNAIYLLNRLRCQDETVNKAIDMAVDSIELATKKFPATETVREEWGYQTYAYCPHCGEDLDIDTKQQYCPECGQRLNWDWDEYLDR